MSPLTTNQLILLLEIYRGFVISNQENTGTFNKDLAVLGGRGLIDYREEQIKITSKGSELVRSIKQYTTFKAIRIKPSKEQYE